MISSTNASRSPRCMPGTVISIDSASCPLAEQGTRRSPGEQIRIGDLHVEGLCGDVLDDDLVQGNERLSALYRTLRHYRGEPVR